MRPPSYYSNLATSNAINSRNSSQQLRSSFSSSSSSSYVNRTHLPFVAQSTLVAHCITGAGSTTRPYGHSATYTPSTSLSSYSPSYTSSYSRPKSTKSHNPYLTQSSGYSSGNSSYSSRSTYLRPTSSYRATTSSSSYYKPIRLRERPLLAQISRQINTRPAPVSSVDVTSKTSEELQGSQEPAEKAVTETTAPISQEVKSSEDPDSRVADRHQDESNWSRDVARNISRNKYLIKFREIDKRKSSLATEDIEKDKPETVERQLESDDMKIPTNATTTCEAELQFKKSSPEQIEVTTKKEDKNLAICDKKGTLLDENANESAAGEDLNSSETKKKIPKEKRNIKLKIKPLASANEQQVTSAKQSKKKAKENSPDCVDGQTRPKLKRLVKTSKVKTPTTPPADTDSSKTPNAVTPKIKTSPRSKHEKSGDHEVSLVDQRKSSEPKPSESSVAPEIPLSSDSSPVSVSGRKRIRFRNYHLEDFNFLSVLGHGGWGFVILAELKEHDSCFAVKCIKKITIVEDDDFDSIMIERKVLTLGNVHPFICKLFCTFETEGYLFFVMEYCAGGDLMFHVQREGKFTESRCRFYASEIICAIRFLHNRHIIYRDLKLDNILLDSSGHIRLVDFGMCQCRSYREEMLPSNFCGTPEYISPEIIKGVPYNHSVDWWSFGVLLYEMAVGKMPFRGGDENELLWNVCYEQIHYPMFLTKELTSLLQLLLEREPKLRMGMATCKSGDIYDQPWFRGVDWRATEEMRLPPPFVPEVISKSDVQNFDTDFTESAPELSPVSADTLKRIDQRQFEKFPYTNPNISIFD